MILPVRFDNRSAGKPRRERRLTTAGPETRGLRGLRKSAGHAALAAMSDFLPASPPRVLYCRCAYAQVVPREVKDGVLRHLCDSGAAFESVADLCEMSARRDPRLAEIAAEGPLKIVACHPRAVRWLFHAAGAPLPADEATASVVNMRALSIEEACAALDAPPTEAAEAAAIPNQLPETAAANTVAA